MGSHAGIVNKVPFYLETEQGNIFCLHLSPTNNTINELVIFVPPFAEEMNKTRHMMFLAARQIALDGKASLIFDFYGTGDSDGQFVESNLNIWFENIDKILHWAHQNNYRKLSFVGIRLGALLLFEYLSSHSQEKINIGRLILWQPVLDGANFMMQFLRLRMAADFISSSEKVTTKSLIENLKNGEDVEVAGYLLSSQLYSDISGLKLIDMISDLNFPVTWLEIIADVERPVGMAARKTIESSEWHVKPEVQKIIGEQFWATPEISNNSGLVELTANLISQS